MLASNFDINLPDQTNDWRLNSEYNPYEWTPPLNLKLSVTKSLVQEINDKLEPTNTQLASLSTKIKNASNPLDQDKCKACNFPATYLQIGEWNKRARHDMDITIKFYFKKKKMALEALEGSLKTKLEIKFSDVAALRFLNLCTSHEGVLEILVDAKPQFFRETNPKPKKHTVWLVSQDFTAGQASLCRKHVLRFNPGSLELLYKRIAAADSLLLSLTSQPFPTDENPRFDQNLAQISFENPNPDQDYFNSCQFSSVQPPILQTGYPPNNFVAQEYSPTFDEFPCSSSPLQEQFPCQISSLIIQPTIQSGAVQAPYKFFNPIPNYEVTYEPNFTAPSQFPSSFASELMSPEYCFDQQQFPCQFSSFKAPCSIATFPSSTS